jgi:tryptophanase
VRFCGYHLLLKPQGKLKPGRRICTNNEQLYLKMRELVPLYEGFLTYGGMSVREIEAMAVGLQETLTKPS